MIVLSLWKGPIKVRVTMADIAADVAEIYGVTVFDIRGPSRARREVIPRNHFVWLCRKQPHLSLNVIGRYLGNRDHTTIINSERRHQARIDDEAFAELA